jgi:hypothetical protein
VPRLLVRAGRLRPTPATVALPRATRVRAATRPVPQVTSKAEQPTRPLQALRAELLHDAKVGRQLALAFGHRLARVAGLGALGCARLRY